MDVEGLQAADERVDALYDELVGTTGLTEQNVRAIELRERQEYLDQGPSRTLPANGSTLSEAVRLAEDVVAEQVAKFGWWLGRGNSKAEAVIVVEGRLWPEYLAWRVATGQAIDAKSRDFVWPEWLASQESYQEVCEVVTRRESELAELQRILEQRRSEWAAWLANMRLLAAQLQFLGGGG